MCLKIIALQQALRDGEKGATLDSVRIRCHECGCDDPRIIEINHVFGGGAMEARRLRYYRQFYSDILSGVRTTEDLNLLCKVCNILHYIQLKFGINMYSIEYHKKEEE